MACQAQLVNVIAPIMTEPGGEAWRQSIFFPVATTFGTARGNSLDVGVSAPAADTAAHDDVPTVAAAATHDPETGQVALFVTHRGGTDTDVVVDHRAFGGWQVRSAHVVAADDKGPLHGADAAAQARPVPLDGVARRQARPRFACHPSPGPRWSSTRPEAPRADRREARTLEGGRAMTAGHQPRAAVPVSRRQLLRGASALAIGGALGTSLSGCADSALSGLSVSHRAAGTLSYWNLFGGGDGVRMQTMQDGYPQGQPRRSRCRPSTLAWGNPYYTKLSLATVGGKPPNVAVVPPDPDEDAGAGRPAAGAATRRPRPVRHHAGQVQRARPGRPASSTGRSYAIPLDTHPFVLFYNTKICEKAGLLDSDGNAQADPGQRGFVDALRKVEEGDRAQYGGHRIDSTPTGHPVAVLPVAVLPARRQRAGRRRHRGRARRRQGQARCSTTCTR